MSAATLVARDLVRVFDDGTRALDGVSLEARAGRVLTLLGPSGCGKSTLLRIIAGLDAPTSGSLTLDGRPLDGVPPGERGVGFVFQNYALYPHLTVAGNMGLALEAARVPRDERERRVRETAAMLGLETLLARRPGQLSGGQQQRVALGRALARRPRLYLLDEPLSNLDAALRETMRGELKALFRRVEAIVVYVTHDQSEAMSLSDEVAVLRAGRLVQRASPMELYARPADLFAATFVGSPRMNVWRGPVEHGALVAGDVRIPLPPGLAEVVGELAAGIRPEDVEVAASPSEGMFPAEVRLAEPTGPQVLLTLSVEGAPEEVRALAPPRDWPGRVFVRWPRERLHGFDPRDGRRVGPGATKEVVA